MKILGVTFTSGLSVSEDIQTIIGSCAQTLYALRTLRAHGMDDTAVGLQTIYRSVIVTKLANSSSAWWGFPGTAGRQKIDAFIRRSQRNQSTINQNQLVPPNLPLFAELCRAADDKLFQHATTITTSYHCLQ